jgi:hypothetical protein
MTADTRRPARWRHRPPANTLHALGVDDGCFAHWVAITNGISPAHDEGLSIRASPGHSPRAAKLYLVLGLILVNTAHTGGLLVHKLGMHARIH